MTVRFLFATGLATLAAMTFMAASSPAASVFTNSTPIKMSAGGTTASPYPSAIEVQGEPGKVVGVTVTLHAFTHTWPKTVDILLVSPDGRTSYVMSDACGSTAVTRYTWIFNDTAPSTMPSAGPCEGLLYRPTDYAGVFADSFGAGAPPGPYTANFGNFIGATPNGTWRLYVVAPSFSASGSIELGWSLTLDTAVPDAVVPSDPSGKGAADPYPLTRTVSGVNGVITDLDVSLTGVYHARPADLEMVLEGPHGQKVALMSDVCGGSTAVNQAWAWDDEAISPMYGATACPDGTYRPGSKVNDELMPYPLTLPLDLRTTLREFDLTDPNGEWRLWVYDDQAGAGGAFTQRFKLDIETRPKAKVGFAQGAIDVTEGQTGELKLVRSASTALGLASVNVATSPLTATSQDDYRYVGKQITFFAGESEKTIPIEALADGLAEEPETLAVKITSPVGDAELATPPTAVVTIRDPASVSGSSDTPATTDPVTTGGSSGGAVADHDPPVISGLTLAPSRFAAARGTTIRYTLSEPGSVALEFRRAVSGRRRYVLVGTLRRDGRAGANRIAVRGRIGRRALRRGAYRLRVRAVDAAGNRSAWRSKGFRVLGRATM
jgi:subtilisin-like proprotein convertase family protein